MKKIRNKKFEAEDDTITIPIKDKKIAKKIIKILSKEKPQKGCGKMFGKIPLRCGADKQVLFKDRIGLCPACQEKNHSRGLEKSGQTRQSAAVISGGEGSNPSPTNSPHLNSTKNSSFSKKLEGKGSDVNSNAKLVSSGSDFNLSEERRKLIRVLARLKRNKTSVIEVLDCIEKQDKEFISQLNNNFEKRLKVYEMKIIHGKKEETLREHEKRALIKEEIDKLAGKNLSGKL